VRKITVILFLFIYLSSVTELHELVKLPVLLEHFTEHKEKTKRLSFWAFLHMHYAQQNEADGDNDRDMQLPFKSQDGCSSVFLSSFVNATAGQLDSKPQISTCLLFSDYSDDFLSPAHLSTIWQPPKAR